MSSQRRRNDRGLAILDLFRPLRLEPLPGVATNPFRLRADGPRGVSLLLQRSANLTEWQDWQSVTFRGSPVEVADFDAATGAHRFYRASVP